MITITACALALLTVSPQPADDWSTARDVVTRSSITDTEFAALLNHPHAAVRKCALYRLMEKGDARFESVIRDRLYDSSWSVRRQAAQALEFCGTRASRETLERVASGADSAAVRSRALYALGKLADTSSVPVLAALLGDSAWDVRGVAADQLVHFNDTSTLAALDHMAEDDPTNYARLRASATARLLRTPRAAPDATPPPIAGGPDFATRLLILTPVIIGLLMFFGPRRTRRLMSIIVASAAIVVAVGVFLQSIPPADSRPSGLTVQIDASLIAHALASHETTESELRDIVRGMLERRFPGPVEIRGGAPDFSVAREPVRQQLDADTVLNLIALVARGRHTVLTCDDLYQEPFHHTMGLGRTDHAVISARRLDPVLLEEDEPGDQARRVFLDRLEKLAVHEVGHLYSLGHCTEARCVMRSIESVEEFYRMDAEFCPACRSRLHTIAGITG